MTINILMPALSPTMSEGKLAKWHVQAGDKIVAGKVICEIETDKATMEVEAVDEGILGKIVVAEGTEGVKVNSVIAILLEEGEDPSLVNAPTAVAAAPAREQSPAKDPAGTVTVSPPPQVQSGAAGGSRVLISPLARRLAGEAGIAPAGVKGTGPGGRIVKADIEAAIKDAPTRSAGPPPRPAAPASAGPKEIPGGVQPPAPVSPPGQVRKVPHTTIRKVIARRMLESKQLVPHFYLTVDFEIDALIAARSAINAHGKVKVSINDMVIKACAVALRDHPDVNASWTESEMLQYGSVDVSVAVATDRGLVTPIIRQADTKGLRRISEEMRDLAARAKEGRLKLDEFQGGGFTISNLGMFGVREFAAIINPPQAAILAVGAGEQRVVVRDGTMVIRNMMTGTLSVDHRVVDGALGARFMQSLKAYIEQPATMLL